MDRKKKLFIIIGAVVLVVIVIILLISFQGQPGGIKVNKIVMAKSVTKDRKAVNPTNVFSTDDQEIYAVIDFSSLPAGSNFEYRWYSLGSKQMIKTDKRGSKDNFTGTANASIKKSEVRWGEGDYEFLISSGGNNIAKKAFSVKSPEEIEKTAVLSTIKEAVLTKEVDLRGRPKGKSFTVFDVSDKNIYASISYQDIKKRAEFEGKWIFVPEDKMIKSYKKTLLQEGTFAFSINADSDSWLPTKTWAKGKYKLEIYLDGDLIKEISFTVE